MKIDEKTIEYLLDLSRIELGPEETEAQRRDLERIVTYTECLAALDTEGLPEQTHPFGIGGAGGEGAMDHLREDEAVNEDHADEWMRAAPDSKGNYFRVPRTVEE